MKKKQYLCLILWTNVIFVPLPIYAEHIHSRYRRRINQHEYENNYIQDMPETSSSSYGSFIINADDAYTPSPTPKESMTTYMTYNERQSPKYILTASGKENIFEEDKAASEYHPREFQVSYPEKFDSEKIVDQKPTFSTTKRVSGNYEKSRNKYRFSHSTVGEDADKNTKQDSRPFKQHQEAHSQQRGKDTSKARSYNSELQNYPQYQPAYKFAEDFGQKTPTPTAWKQLGPNVEISSSADTPTYARPPPISSSADTSTYVRASPTSVASGKEQQRGRKTYKKRKNTNTKNTRNAYLAPTHALYVANNLQNFKQFKTIFDHNGVLKQSDKFEVGDAMTNEAEKENVGKKEHKVRIKQESPKDQQPYNYETPNVQNYQFYNPPVPGPFYNVPAAFQNHKLGYPGISLSKGFIRMIDVETNSNGDKKTIPALIIPLSQEQLSSPLFNPETAATAYINTLDGIAAKHKPVPFPYEMVNAKYLQNDPNLGLQFENNYQQLQNYYPYQFRNSGQNVADDAGYNPLFYNSPYQSLIPKYAFNLNLPSASTPTSGEPKPTPYAMASPTQAAYYQNEDQRSNLPYSIVIPNKKTNLPTQSENARTDFKPSEYYEDPNDDSKYLSPSETSFIPAVVDPNESYNSSKSFDESDLRS